MTDRNCTIQNPPKQVKTRAIGLDEFIRRSKLKHGDAYDYSISEYKNSTTHIKFICNKCKNVLTQFPPNHMKGARCVYCYGNIQLTTAVFIKRAIKVHGNAFDYSLVNYVRSNDKVTVRCVKHDRIFDQYPLSHLKGHGCTLCADEATAKKLSKPYSQFLKEAKLLNGERYKYRKGSYKNAHSKVGVYCNLHGWFEQSATLHLTGRGCKQCGYDSSGFDRQRFERVCEKNNNGNGLMYVIHCKEHGESFYKIGITSRTVKKRFISKGHLPYDFTELYVIEGEAAYIYDLENKIHALLKDHHYSPKIDFKGSVYECFTKITKPVEKLLKQLESTEQLQLLA